MNFAPINTEKYSKNLQNLLESTLQKDPDLRPDIETILENPIVKEKVGGLIDRVSGEVAKKFKEINIDTKKK